MSSKIQKWGNSLGLRIPKSIAEQAGVYAGSEVDFAVEDGDLIVRPRRRPRPKLADLLDAITEENRHPEVDTGKRVGREQW
jgi:antitoxin MazE